MLVSIILWTFLTALEKEESIEFDLLKKVKLWTVRVQSTNAESGGYMIRGSPALYNVHDFDHMEHIYCVGELILSVYTLLLFE